MWRVCKGTDTKDSLTVSNIWCKHSVPAMEGYRSLFGHFFSLVGMEVAALRVAVYT